jgi:hypothetical protein
MRTTHTFFLSALAVAIGLAACGGGDDDASAPAFQYPATNTPTVLPSTLLMTADNAEKTPIRLGGSGSSLSPHPTLPGYFYSLTDRGPNTTINKTPSGIIFLKPDYNPHITLYRLTATGSIEEVKTIALKTPGGTRLISGLPNKAFGSTGETPYNLDGSVVTYAPDSTTTPGYDNSGLDSEGLVAMKDGTFWVSDEYGPHMVHFDENGNEIERINPFAADGRNKAGRVLPAELAKRWPNRGMEGLAITPDGETLVGMMQNNLYNPSMAAVGNVNIVRIVTINLRTGARAQYLYRQEGTGLVNSEIVALSSTTFAVIERDQNFYNGSNAASIVKKVYKIDISQATNIDTTNTTLVNSNPAFSVSTVDTGLLVNGNTLEQVIKTGTAPTFQAGWDQLTALNVKPVTKVLAVDAIEAVQYPHDKLEGLWVIDANTLGLMNDDDFGNASDGANGVTQKKLWNGAVDANTLYVVKTKVPLY